MILEDEKNFKWRPIVDAFLNREVGIDLNVNQLQHILQHAM